MCDREGIDAGECADDDYREVMASIRHYSTLRFVMLTVFITMTSGLLVGEYGEYKMRPPAPLVPLAGLLVTAIFFWLEVTLDTYMNTFAGVARRLRPKGHWNERPQIASTLVVIPLRGLYVVVFLYWLWAFINALAK